MVNGGRVMLSSTRLIAFFLLTVAVQAFAGSQIYRYKDDSGTVNFTNELYSIPEKYRAGAVALMPETPSPLEKPKGPPAIRTVTASAEYRLGDHDSRLDATRTDRDTQRRCGRTSCAGRRGRESLPRSTSRAV